MTHLLRHFYINAINLSRQAWDKHRESTQKRDAFFAGCVGELRKRGVQQVGAAASKGPCAGNPSRSSPLAKAAGLFAVATWQPASAVADTTRLLCCACYHSNRSNRPVFTGSFTARLSLDNFDRFMATQVI